MISTRINFTDSIHEFLDGNMDAFQFIYNQSIQIFKSETLKYMKTEFETDDVLQEVYLYIYEHLADLRDPLNFIGWGLTICRSRAVNALKSKERITKRTEYRPITSEDDQKGLDTLSASEYSNFKTPEEQMDAQETKEILDSILGDLPEIQRACILLWQESYSTKEIAEEMEIPLGTAKSNIYYAKKKIMSRVEELKTQGVNLHGLAPIPFFIWLLRMYDMLYTPAKPAMSSVASYANLVQHIPNTVPTSSINPQFANGNQIPVQIHNWAGNAIPQQTIITSATAKLGVGKILAIVTAVCVFGGGAGYGGYRLAERLYKTQQTENVTDDVANTADHGTSTDSSESSLDDIDDTNPTAPEESTSEAGSSSARLAKQIGYEYIGNQLISEDTFVKVPTGCISAAESDIDSDGQNETVALILSPNEEYGYDYTIEVFKQDKDQNWSSVASLPFTENNKLDTTTQDSTFHALYLSGNTIVVHDSPYAQESDYTESSGQRTYQYSATDKSFHENNIYTGASFYDWIDQAINLGSITTSYCDISFFGGWVPDPESWNSTKETNYIINLNDYTDMSTLTSATFSLQYPKYFDDYLYVQTENGSADGPYQCLSHNFCAKYITILPYSNSEPSILGVSEQQSGDLADCELYGGWMCGSGGWNVLWNSPNNLIVLEQGGDAGALLQIHNQNNPDGFSNLELANIYWMIKSDDRILHYTFQYTGSEQGTTYPLRSTDNHQ
ncbi:MAG: sigma-70 family RNA polymerase sigma factor [Clostridia bacterium]|nr:sigma-70 family RNA polymerase sigma factor [Clostridia bacterium]